MYVLLIIGGMKCALNFMCALWCLFLWQERLIVTSYFVVLARRIFNDWKLHTLHFSRYIMAGIKNPENLCYCNSTLQFLGSCPVYERLLQSHSDTCRSGEYFMVTLLQETRESYGEKILIQCNISSINYRQRPIIMK